MTAFQKIIKKTAKSNAVFTQISVGVGATLLATVNEERIDLAVINVSAQTVYVGVTPGVTIANGFPIPPNTGISFDQYTGALYGIVSAGTALCGVITV